MLYLIPLLWFTHGTTAECIFGKYGENCSLNCSSNCRQLLSGDRHCDETTGECSEGCIPGFYTPFCNATCANCLQHVCDFIDGSCSLNCENKACENKPCGIKPCEQNPEETWKIIAVVAISLFVVVGVFVICICRRLRGCSRNVDTNAKDYKSQDYIKTGLMRQSNIELTAV